MLPHPAVSSLLSAASGQRIYAVAFVLAFFSVAASVGLCLLLALFFALTGALTRVFGDRPSRTEISS